MRYETITYVGPNPWIICLVVAIVGISATIAVVKIYLAWDTDNTSILGAFVVALTGIMTIAAIAGSVLMAVSGNAGYTDGDRIEAIEAVAQREADSTGNRIVATKHYDMAPLPTSFFYTKKKNLDNNRIGRTIEISNLDVQHESFTSGLMWRYTEIVTIN